MPTHVAMTLLFMSMPDASMRYPCERYVTESTSSRNVPKSISCNSINCAMLVKGLPWMPCSAKSCACWLSVGGSSRRATMACALVSSIPGNNASVSGGAVLMLIKPLSVSSSVNVTLSVMLTNSSCVNIFTSLSASTFWKVPCVSR